MSLVAEGPLIHVQGPAGFQAAQGLRDGPPPWQAAARRLAGPLQA
jgi:hypothetical protein